MLASNEERFFNRTLGAGTEVTAQPRTPQSYIRASRRNPRTETTFSGISPSKKIAYK